MLRALFFSLGLTGLMLGGLLAFTDRLVLREFVVTAETGPVARLREASWMAARLEQVNLNGTPVLTLTPPAWFAYAALSVGLVVVLYAVALPASAQKKKD